MRGDDEMWPLISVIVPIYKVETYLNHCIESIVNQTYRNLEIILVDDGSPDNCPTICDTWAKNDPRIIVIHKENGGLSDARNSGIKVSSGEMIAFVDSDDYIKKTFIEDMYVTMKRTKAEIVECGVLYIDEAHNVLYDRTMKSEITLDRMGALESLILENGVYQTVWNKLYQSRMIKDIPFEFGRYHEDDFWTYKVLDRVQKITILSEPLYYYMQRATSIMGNNYTLKRLDGLEARYNRMMYLKKYDNLNNLLYQKLLLDCMWHYQCVSRVLNGKERREGVCMIHNIINQVPFKSISNMDVNNRYRFWLYCFKIAPNITSKVRNFLKIGL